MGGRDTGSEEMGQIGRDGSSVLGRRGGVGGEEPHHRERRGPSEVAEQEASPYVAAVLSELRRLPWLLFESEVFPE